MFAAVAQAQGITERHDRVDRPAPREIEGLALRRSSSVASASVDSIVEERPDNHVTPDVYLKWSHQYDWFKASAEIGASLDRYEKTSDANLDGVHSSLKIAKTDGKWEAVEYNWVTSYQRNKDSISLPPYW